MHKNRTFQIILPFLLAAAVIIGMVIGLYIARSQNSTHVGRAAKAAATNNKLTYTLSLIDQLYVDPVNLDSISEHMLPLLLAELDPHSVYIPAQDVAPANEVLDGEFDGIGVVFNMMTDTVVVLNVIHGGPSHDAGVQNGDRIIRINDTIVAGRKMEQTAVVKLLRGKRGTQVNLGVERQGIKGLVPITVTRGTIPIKSINAAFMIRPGIAYMKLSAFSKTSIQEVIGALDRLRGEGMTRLIFDLRENAGGFLDQAIEIANQFLPAGKLIVYTLDRRQKRTEEYSDGKGRYPDVPLAVLIDEASASSSEILAGALQDNDRGVIIGRRSFGKGLVQQQIFYPDRSAIRLTIARYYTPTGRSIQKPYDRGRDEYALDLQHRYDHNEFFSADSIQFADSLKFTTPGGRTVYGGGGIMPDIFIPWDTTNITRYYVEVAGRNILYRYAIDYADRHREHINRISTLPELKAFLDADLNLLENFVAYAARQGVAPNRAQISKSRVILLAQLRANIARNTILDDNGFYDNIYVIDKAILRAIEELNKE